MSVRHSKRRFWIVALLLAAAIFAANAGRILVIENPQPSDVIVVLAGETDRRPARALELLNQGYAPRILLNVPAEANIYQFTQIQLAEKYVQDLPQNGSIAICPIHGLSTHDESRDVEKCLTHESGNRVLIVTSDFHTRRALSVFRREVIGKSFSISAAHDDAQFGVQWWTHRQWAKTCFEEWLRLFWWYVIDRWH